MGRQEMKHSFERKEHIICNRCGYENDIEDIFCNSCGNTIAKDYGDE